MLLGFLSGSCTFIDWPICVLGRVTTNGERVADEAGFAPARYTANGKRNSYRALISGGIRVSSLVKKFGLETTVIERLNGEGCP